MRSGGRGAWLGCHEADCGADGWGHGQFHDTRTVGTTGHLHFVAGMDWSPFEVSLKGATSPAMIEVSRTLSGFSPGPPLPPDR